MLISSKIDQLIESLTALKPALSDDNNQNLLKFNEILSNSLEQVIFEDKQAPIAKNVANTDGTNQVEIDPSGVPSWVDRNFPYDPNNPRKPTTRELSAALAGITPEETYSSTLIADEAYNKIQHTSREIMFGVIGTNKDSRDWQKIMSSTDVLEAARSETNKMYGPVLKIVSEENTKSDFDGQHLALEDRNGRRLISMTHTAPIIQEKLLNFGADTRSIPDNIDSLAAGGKIDNDTLEMLKNFNKAPAKLSFDQAIMETATDAISRKIDQGIPLDEFSKL